MRLENEVARFGNMGRCAVVLGVKKNCGGRFWRCNDWLTLNSMMWMCRLRGGECAVVPGGDQVEEETEILPMVRRLEIRALFMDEDPGKAPVHDSPSLYRPQTVVGGGGNQQDVGGEGSERRCLICGLVFGRRAPRFDVQMYEETFGVPTHISLCPDIIHS